MSLIKGKLNKNTNEVETLGRQQTRKFQSHAAEWQLLLGTLSLATSAFGYFLKIY